MRESASKGASALAEKSIDDKAIDTIIENFGTKPGALLGILEAAQQAEEHQYLPESVLEQIAIKTKIPASRVYSVASFYSFFNLKPQGRHSIVVCRGTACHTRGSKALLENALAALGSEPLGEGETSFTTLDREFSVRTVACFGQCALSPVIAIDGVILSRMTEGKLIAALKKLKKEVAK
jgi:NADH-quinone oxidoreductase subunit E